MIMYFIKYQLVYITPTLSFHLFVSICLLQQVPTRNNPLRLLPMHRHPAPTLLSILLLHLLTRPQSPFRNAHHGTALKHESTAALAHFSRLQLGVPRAFSALGVGAVARHGIMQARASGDEPSLAAALGVVAARDEAHELGHCVAMVVGGTEGVFGDEPAWGEDYKVGDGGAGDAAGGGEDGEDGGVRVVVGDCADGVEAAQIVFVGVVVAVPGDDVKGGMRLRGGEVVIVELDRDGVVILALVRRRAKVLVEAGDGHLEVARVGEAVCADGPQLGEGEVALVELEGVAAGRAGGEVDLVFDAAGDDCDLEGPDEEPAVFCADVEGALLRDDEEVAVGRVESRLGVHAAARGVDVHADALLQGRVARAGDEAHAGDKVPFLGLVMVKGVPAELVGDVLERGGLGAGFRGRGCRRGVRVVGAGGEDAVEPGLFALVARRREGGSGELFGVEAVGGLLWGVLADREGVGDGFGSGEEEKVEMLAYSGGKIAGGRDRHEW